MKAAIYPGTFDPITYGHIDVLKKASKVFDEIILAVAGDTGEKTFFSLEERLELCRKSTEHLSKIKVVKFTGLVVEFTRKAGAVAMIRGLRAVSDFEYELSLALMNKKLHPEVETVFFVPDNKFLYLSSTMVRQIVDLGGSIKDLIPECVEQALKKKKNQTQINADKI